MLDFLAAFIRWLFEKDAASYLAFFALAVLLILAVGVVMEEVCRR